jgi:hypothetical protein
VAMPQVLSQLGSGMRGKRLVYYSDSQAAAAAINRVIIGVDPVFRVVKRIYALCAEHGVLLQVRWHPRTAPLARQADTWSKCWDIC